MKNLFFIFLFSLLIKVELSFSQANLLNAKVPQEVGFQNAQQIEVDNNRPVEYGYVDDRDVLWSKTVYEIIDLNERINFPYYYPSINNGKLSESRKSLFRVLIDAIKEGQITEIYQDEYFEEKITFSDLQDKLNGKKRSDEGTELLQEDPNAVLGDEYFFSKEIESGDVSQYRIKGTWYVDKRLGELKYRLLGIAPFGVEANDYLDDNIKIEEAIKIAYFWVWFPDAREVLNSNRVFNPKNSSQPITYDNMLNSRRFNSIIYREENVYEDRDIKSYVYKDALRQLLESDRIKSVIRDFEQDLWNN